MLKTIVLDARPQSELNWDLSSKAPCLWQLDFGPLLPHTIAACENALNHFFDKIDLAVVKAVRLYEGAPTEDLPDYLDRLVALFPDEIQPWAHFDLSKISSKADGARLISTERYPWIHVENRPHPTSKLGLLFPLEEQCTHENLAKLDKVMESIGEPYRIVYEYDFTESWNELDEVIVVDEMLGALGERKLQGFTVAGGKIRGRGI